MLVIGTIVTLMLLPVNVGVGEDVLGTTTVQHWFVFPALVDVGALGKDGEVVGMNVCFTRVEHRA